MLPVTGGAGRLEHLFPGGAAHRAIGGQAVPLLVAADGFRGLGTIFAVSGQGLALAAQLLLHQPDGSAGVACRSTDAG